MRSKYQRTQSAIDWNRGLKANEYTQRRITFGQYAGTMVKDIPIDYIKWGVLNFNGAWAEMFARELQRRDKSLKK